jgi:hypothetical protein
VSDQLHTPAALSPRGRALYGWENEQLGGRLGRLITKRRVEFVTNKMRMWMTGVKNKRINRSLGSCTD